MVGPTLSGKKTISGRELVLGENNELINHRKDSGRGVIPVWSDSTGTALVKPDGTTTTLGGGGDNVLNVMDYGAIGDGVTDDAAAIHATYDVAVAAGGGHVYFPAGTYKYVSPAGINNNSITFGREASNVITYGDGIDKTIILVSGAVGVRFGLARNAINTHGGSPPDWGLPTMKQFNIALRGAMSVTCTTVGDAANYTAGMIVWLQSGDASSATGHPPYNFEFNEVVSSDAGTGAVVLKYALKNGYNSDDASYPPLIAIMTAVPTNNVYRDMTFTGTIGSNAPVLNATGLKDCLFERVKIRGMFWTSASENLRFDKCVFEALSIDAAELVSDLGDATRELWITDSLLQYAYADILKGSGSMQNSHFHRNIFRDMGIGTIGGGIVLGGTTTTRPMRGVFITDNIFYLSNDGGSGEPFGVLLSGDATGCVINNNLINLEGSTSVGIELRASASQTTNKNTVIGNTINANGYCISVNDQGNSGGVVTDNVVAMNVMTTTYGGGGLKMAGTGTTNNHNIANVGIGAGWDVIGGSNSGPMLFNNVQFSAVGTAPNGTIIYVSDGTAGAPLTGAGGGCFAFRKNGAWLGV
jgi:Pectate lyase superfamily protein